MSKGSDHISGGSTPRKRVRFKEEDDIVKSRIRNEKIARSMDPMEALEGEINAVSLAVIDAPEAAARRAHARRAALMSLYDDHTPSDDAFLREDMDTTVLLNCNAHVPEQDYTEPEERFNESGIPFEPFHMKVEYEEGYFDEVTGEYVEYEVDGEADAWVDALPDVDEVDKEWLQRIAARARDRGSRALEEGLELPEMRPDEFAHYKQRIIQLLQPGENVLQALRRLGKARIHTTTAAADTGATGVTPHATPQVTGRLSDAPMAPTAKSIFDELTSASSLLMEAGEYDIHTITREELAGSVIRRIAGQGDVAVDDVATIEHSSNGDGDGGVLLAAQLLASAQAVDNNIHACMSPGHAVTDATDAVTATSILTESQGAARPSTSTVRDDSTTVRGVHELPVDIEEDIFSGTQTSTQTREAVHSNNSRAPAHTASHEASAPHHHAASQNDLQGFVRDEMSGYLYNSSMGCYYDPLSKLFGDAASGKWYRVDAATGKYILVG